MNIKSLEINLLKTSEINENDTILVKIDEDERKKLNKEDIQKLYNQIQSIVKKNISIYFFPKNLSVDIIKNHVKNIESSKKQIEEEAEKLNNEND
jgi:uncharacterized alkaline shock family protein YloU